MNLIRFLLDYQEFAHLLRIYYVTKIKSLQIKKGKKTKSEYQNSVISSNEQQAWINVGPGAPNDRMFLNTSEMSSEVCLVNLNLPYKLCIFSDA